MLKIMLLSFVLSLVPHGIAMAQEVSVQAQCAKEWKEFKTTNGRPAKGEGREVWNVFYKVCRAQKAGGITQADKAALLAKIEEYSKR